MAKATLKQKVIDSINKLPKDASLDEIIERIYFIHIIEVGLKQSEHGDGVEHEKLMNDPEAEPSGYHSNSPNWSL